MIAIAKFSLLTFALAASSSQVLAADVSRRAAVSSLRAISTLVARQTEESTGPMGFSKLIPEQCKSDCAPIVAIDTETCVIDVKCVCTDQVLEDYAACLKCITGIDSEDDQAKKDSQTTMVNGLLSDFVEDCKADGVTVKAVNIGGSDDKGSALSMSGSPAIGIALGAAAVVLIGL